MVDETSTTSPGDASDKSDLPANLPAVASAQAGALLHPPELHAKDGASAGGSSPPAVSLPALSLSNVSNPPATTELAKTAASAAQPPASPVEEAHIINEVIVKPAPTAASGPTPVPKPTPIVASDLLTTPAESAPPLSVPESNTSPAPQLPPPPRESAPLPEPPHTAEKSEKERAVISQILEEAKLPERRESPSEPLTKERPHVFDTVLSTGRSALIGPIPSGPVGVAPASAENRAVDDVAVHQEKTVSQTQSLASSIVAPLRTLKNDLQEIVRVNKISLVRAAALGSEKRNRSNILGGEVVRAHSHRTFGMLFAASLLFVLGLAALLGIYVVMTERSSTPPKELENSILFAESVAPFPLGNLSALEAKRTLAQVRGGSNATLGSITHIVPTVSGETPAEEGGETERPATLEEFLKTLGARASPDLVRALSSEFFFGIHTVDENAPLLVIPVLSYERAFAGMLSWEQSMNGDLSPVFTSVPDQILGGSGLPEKRRFEDVVMRNYDVRALKDDGGEIELYYSFPTRTLLVIGESPYSFTEILSRLRAGRKL